MRGIATPTIVKRERFTLFESPCKQLNAFVPTEIVNAQLP